MAALWQHLAELCKRREGGGSEGGGHKSQLHLERGGPVANMIIDGRLKC